MMAEVCPKARLGGAGAPFHITSSVLTRRTCPAGQPDEDRPAATPNCDHPRLVRLGPRRPPAA